MSTIGLDGVADDQRRENSSHRNLTCMTTPTISQICFQPVDGNPIFGWIKYLRQASAARIVWTRAALSIYIGRALCTAQRWWTRRGTRSRRWSRHPGSGERTAPAGRCTPTHCGRRYTGWTEARRQWSDAALVTARKWRNATLPTPSERRRRGAGTTPYGRCSASSQARSRYVPYGGVHSLCRSRVTTSLLHLELRIKIVNTHGLTSAFYDFSFLSYRYACMGQTSRQTNCNATATFRKNNKCVSIN